MEYNADNTGALGFMSGFSSNSLTVKEETYLYPFISFLAEAGGSLGLFLGFSFLMTLDYITPVLIALKKSVKKHV